jgi:uncharacterized membrane protein (UPF0127 family)
MADGAVELNVGGAKTSRWGRVALLLVLAIFGLSAFVALRACDDTASVGLQSVKVGGQWFHLEVADTDTVRMKGLGQRDHIEDDGGMLFVFTAPQDPTRGGFVMRDCPIDIDIIYLDGSGRVGNWHAMKADPRKPGEGDVGETGAGKPLSPGAEAYEQRLHRYEPRYAYQFAVELKGGTIDSKLKGKLKEGDKIDMPLEALKKRAK